MKFTRVSAPAPSLELATIDTQSGVDKKVRRIGMRGIGRRALATLAALGAAGGMAVLASPSIASATSLSEYPSFGCFATGTGGVVQANDLPVNLDLKTTGYYALVYRWTGSQWSLQGIPRGSDGEDFIRFTDSSLGVLAEEPMTLSVPHGYYAVLYETESSGDTGAQSYWAGVNTANTYFSANVCQL